MIPHSTKCWLCPCVLSFCLILLLNSASVSLMHLEGSAAFSKALGLTVFDMKIAADFSILGSQKEFVRRYCQHREEEPRLPMLTSAGPGWDRYAEHVLGHPITPHLCMTKSPQQIMGSLVKDYFTRQQNLSADKIFHVIVASFMTINWRPFEKMFPQLHTVPRVLTVC
uniref:Iron hydrogenase large subunit C-terminal domain-containing protein n=1 Tax=Myotis myotis TaxID=51298 RepID=A0A7J7YEA3_MYOMY|nr:hypothetical protein mMyoMyo1_011167 [Myotis myotis]